MPVSVPAWSLPVTLTLSPIQLSLLLTLAGLLVIGLFVALVRRRDTARREDGGDWTISALNSFAAVLSPIWLGLLVSVLYALWYVIAALVPVPTGEDLRWHVLAFVGLITAFGALVAAPIALIRVYTTERQTRVAEQGHMTDRISKAVEQLGAEKTVKRRVTDAEGKEATVEQTVPNIEVRIGGLYALERIAQDSMATDRGRDHIRVMELLCAYVRENAPASIAKDVKEGTIDFPEPRTEIQIAMQVIGRRSPEQIALERGKATQNGAEGYRLDLRATFLREIEIASMNFAFARFTGAKMEGADLRGAQIERADLRHAQIRSAVLWDAQMAGADLSRAQMEGAEFYRAQMQGADLSYAQMKGADLSRAQMEGADLSGAKMLEANLSYAQMHRTHLCNAEMYRARLSGAQMEGADLTGAQMQGAVLGGAQMEGAVLRYANLQSTDLSDWSTARTSLRSVDFTGSYGLTQQAVNAAWGDRGTILPEGIKPPDHWDSDTLGPFETDPKYDAWLAAGAPPGKPVP
jgi:uncharacterized protein YjbI with pentapeptide repeats